MRQATYGIIILERRHCSQNFRRQYFQFAYFARHFVASKLISEKFCHDVLAFMKFERVQFAIESVTCSFKSLNQSGKKLAHKLKNITEIFKRERSNACHKLGSVYQSQTLSTLKFYALQNFKTVIRRLHQVSAVAY